MKHVTSFIPLTGIVLVLFSQSLFAAEILVDDFADADKVNALEGEWSYYDDGIGSGKNERLQAKTDIGIQGSKVNVSSAPKQLPTGGFDYNIKVYTFNAQDVDGEQYAYMPFTFGSKWQDSTGAIEAFVGISTSLSADGQPMDLTDYSGVKFKIKSANHDLKVTFMIETADVEADSMYAYHQRVFNVAMGTWNEIAIPLAGLAQPLWTPDTAKKAFDPTKAVRLTWQVSLSKNPGLEEMASDEIDIDDVVLTDAPIAVVNDRISISSHQSAFKAVYHDGIVKLEGESINAITKGIVRLFNANGKIVYTHRIAAATDMQNTFTGKRLPNGLYFVQVDGIGNDHGNITMRSSLFVAK